MPRLPVLEFLVCRGVVPHVQNRCLLPERPPGGQRVDIAPRLLEQVGEFRCGIGSNRRLDCRPAVFLLYRYMGEYTSSRKSTFPDLGPTLNSPPPKLEQHGVDGSTVSIPTIGLQNFFDTSPCPDYT